MILAATDCTLLLVDFQQRLMPAIADGDAVVNNATRLAEAARLLDIPMLATEQNPEGLGTTVAALAGYPHRIMRKAHFDGTRETPFADLLPAERSTVVVAGCETHVCVLQTVLGLLSRGARVALVRDAVGSRRVENRDAALDRVRAHGGELVTTEMALFEWLGASDHPRFRDVLQLVK
jgi:nicotinamidase-related amidase